MFITIIVILFIISFVWAIYSLFKELKKPQEIEDAKNDLAKEKILFKAE